MSAFLAYKSYVFLMLSNLNGKFKERAQHTEEGVAQGPALTMAVASTGDALHSLRACICEQLSPWTLVRGADSYITHPPTPSRPKG